MDKVVNLLPSAVRAIVARYPAIVPHLRGRARWVAFAHHADQPMMLPGMGRFIERAVFTDYKTYDYFLTTMQNLIHSVYTGTIAGEFIDIMANLISGQLRQAFTQAWADEEGAGELPDYLTGALEDMILSEYDHVDSFYREIVDARLDEKPIDSLLARATLWAQRYTDAYEQARHLITMENGGNEEWVLGGTEEHCPECAALNGIVARASEWEQLGVHPQQPPNAVLTCGGWKCDCERRPTEKRRSPGAFDRIVEIVSK
jgi:hypothetical protein